MEQACPKLGGWGLKPSPNNLLNFVDFINEKGCKSQSLKNEDSNLYIFEEATGVYLKWNISFDVIQVKDFKIFMQRLSLVVILCFCQ